MRTWHPSPSVRKVAAVEAFESFVALALESEGFVVSPAVKFRVKLKTRKTAYEETQAHGYEVDLVGARQDKLVLATVKSFFGSRGVVADHVTREGGAENWQRLYALLNNDAIRGQVVRGAAKRYGYRVRNVELRFYVGRFAARTTRTHEDRIREWARKQRVGSGPIRVFNLDQVVHRVREIAADTQYRDDAVLVTMKVLQEAGLLEAALPDAPK